MPANMNRNYGVDVSLPCAPAPVELLGDNPFESWPLAAQEALIDRVDALQEASEPGAGREALAAYGELCCLYAALDWEWPHPFPVYVADAATDAPRVQLTGFTDYSC